MVKPDPGPTPQSDERPADRGLFGAGHADADAPELLAEETGCVDRAGVEVAAAEGPARDGRYAFRDDGHVALGVDSSDRADQVETDVDIALADAIVRGEDRVPCGGDDEVGSAAVRAQ
jgi:hypothetical protein